MKENPNCTRCQLSSFANERSVCLKGRGSKDAALLILLSAPSVVDDRRHQSFVSDEADYLDNLMKRMSIDRSSYYLDYVLKCYPKTCKAFGTKAHRQQMIEACSIYRIATLQFVKPKAVVLMGSTACEAVMGSEKVALFEGTDWIPREPKMREFVDKVWITYSAAYGLQDPTESVGIYRVLLNAAIDAGLSPRYDNKLIQYDYGT